MSVQINGSDGRIISTHADHSGNVSIGGTLTYEDVTNIDSVGLVTARSGIEIGARPGVAASISVDGNMIVSGISTFGGDVKLPDSKKIVLGAGSDLQIYHDGSSSLILNNNNTQLTIASDNALNLTSRTDTEYFFRGYTGGAAELYYDNSKKLETTNTGVTVTGNITSTKLLSSQSAGSAGLGFGDNVQIHLGDSDDFRIYHSGDWNYIQSYNSKNLAIQVKDNENAVIAIPDGEVQLYHNNELQALTAANGLRIKTAGDTNTELSVVGPEGRSGIINLEADDGDDNADIWRMIASTDGKFYLQNYTSGSYENTFRATGNGAVELYYDNSLKFETSTTGADFYTGTGEIDIYSTGSGEKYSLRLLNADASAGNQIGIYFGPANNVVGAYIAGYADEDFTSTANRSASLKFGVRDDGSLKEVGKFTRGGFFKASNSTTYDDHSFAVGAHEFHSNQRYYDTVWIANTNVNYERSGLRFDMTRSASSSYQFITATSGALSDDEFRARGDGNVYADGSFNPNGADYAEYFEWTDGNSSNEDRRGMTVVLDGNKIKVATSSDSTDNIIGVVSGNASVIGDSSWNKWSGKYLKDDYNQYILDSDGHRQLNPSFDDTKTYVSREDRQEWDAIGMVGKLRIRKGQKTGTRWIKMRDISGDVEEWLVR